MGGNIHGLEMGNTPRDIFCQKFFPLSFIWKKPITRKTNSEPSKKRHFLKWLGLSFLLIGFSIFPPNAHLNAQSDIPVGSWRFHQSYLDAGFLKGDDRTVFFYGTESISFLSIEDQSSRDITKLDGLYGQSFTAADFDPKSKLFIVAYPDGTLDVIGEKSIKPVYELRDNAQILDKGIRKIKILESSAFLMADLMRRKTERVFTSFCLIASFKSRSIFSNRVI